VKATRLQDGVQSRRFHRGNASHRRALHTSSPAEAQEPSRSAIPSRPGAGASARTGGAAPRGPRGPPQRGRAVPHVPGLPAEDRRHRDLPEPGERHEAGRHHRLRAQGLGVRGAEADHVRQPHPGPAQVAAAVPRAAQVLLAGRVRPAERARPGGHPRRLAVHAEPHLRHGHRPREVHVVRPQDQQQRVLHPPRRGVRGRQGSPADADLQERPPAGACPRSGTGCQGIRRRSQPGVGEIISECEGEGEGGREELVVPSRCRRPLLGDRCLRRPGALVVRIDEFVLTVCPCRRSKYGVQLRAPRV
jgi:hypothetical protein